MSRAELARLSDPVQRRLNLLGVPAPDRRRHVRPSSGRSTHPSIVRHEDGVQHRDRLLGLSCVAAPARGRFATAEQAACGATPPSDTRARSHAGTCGRAKRAGGHPVARGTARCRSPGRENTTRRRDGCHESSRLWSGIPASRRSPSSPWIVVSARTRPRWSHASRWRTDHRQKPQSASRRAARGRRAASAATPCHEPSWSPPQARTTEPTAEAVCSLRRLPGVWEANVRSAGTSGSAPAEPSARCRSRRPSR